MADSFDAMDARTLLLSVPGVLFNCIACESHFGASVDIAREAITRLDALRRYGVDRLSVG